MEKTKKPNSVALKQARRVIQTVSVTAVRLGEKIIPTAFPNFWLTERADNSPVFQVSGWSKQNTASLLTPWEISSSIPNHAIWAACLLLY